MSDATDTATPQRHTARARGEYKCSYCTRTFPYPQNLGRHVQSMHGDRTLPYTKTERPTAAANGKPKRRAAVKRNTRRASDTWQGETRAALKVVAKAITAAAQNSRELHRQNDAFQRENARLTATVDKLSKAFTLVRSAKR